MFIKPAEGKTVHDPFRRDEIPVTGRNVEPNQHWLKQIREGAVIKSAPPTEQNVQPEEGATVEAKGNE